jgi:hypothetical protein
MKMHEKRIRNGLASMESPNVLPQQQLCMLGSRLYGLPDIDIWLHHTSNAQIVKQEFEAYTMANLSPKGTDILRFWVVSIPYLDKSNCC